nr:PREDICTED: olfactory receptor 6N1-like [Latimeria chalumnae]|eukprot:XP_006009370.1 PREDICTED: olfactory receptor 6N1-like [Latimeria chalumnae]
MKLMNNSNQTHHSIEEFILLGFPGLVHSQNTLFLVFLFVYLLILVGNLMILHIVTIERKLHTPMYFFLGSLSVLDIVYPTVILPKMLALFLMGNNIISFYGCFAQMYFFLALGTTECLLLSVMGFDRYLAICYPLRYPSIMTGKVCAFLIGCVWLLGFLAPVVSVVLLMELPYCGSQIIHYCYCDYPSVLILACIDDTEVVFDQAFICAMLVILVPFLFVVVSYIKVVQTIFGNKLIEGKEKAFSTCASHLVSVILFYVTGSVVYIVIKVGNVSNDYRIMMSVTYAVLNPLVNPIIYTLRNKEIKKAIARKRKVLHDMFSDRSTVAAVNI